MVGSKVNKGKVTSTAAVIGPELGLGPVRPVGLRKVGQPVLWDPAGRLHRLARLTF